MQHILFIYNQKVYYLEAKFDSLSDIPLRYICVFIIISKNVRNWLLPINVKVVLSSKCQDRPIEWMLTLHSFVFGISKMVCYFSLKGFKRRLKGIFALDLQDGQVYDDLRTLEPNICNEQQLLFIFIKGPPLKVWISFVLMYVIDL